MRSLVFASLLVLAGCTAALEASGVEPRPIPERVVDGTRVVGFFDAEAVRTITALVRAETDEPILNIAVPVELLNAYYFRQSDALPADRAEVMTGQACEGRCGGGRSFSLAVEDGRWTIVGTGMWRG